MAQQGAYQQAARLPARIMSFTARPDSIQPGQAVTLAWRVENPNAVSIDPEPGPVIARGSKVLTPSATTTYTMTVTGAGNAVLTKTVTVTVAGTTPAKSATPAAKKEIRQIGGHPDLSGVYNSSSFNFGGTEVRGMRDPITATLKPGAEKFKVVRGPTDTGLYADCMPTGVPGAYFVPYQWQIVQGIDRVVILYEYPHLFRTIPTNVPAHQVDLDPTWMGDSIGRWDGDTLVVDTVASNTPKRCMWWSASTAWTTTIWIGKRPSKIPMSSPSRGRYTVCTRCATTWTRWANSCARTITITAGSSRSRAGAPTPLRSRLGKMRSWFGETCDAGAPHQE
jgi:hypothetical protein